MDTRKRILIVDDESNVRLVFRTTLESAGYEVSEASDGGAALEELRERHFDLILLDLKMPVVDGIVTLQRLRDVADETPVVMITAHGRVAEAVAAMKLGAVDFLPKPVSPVSLRAVVATACAGQSTMVGLPRSGGTEASMQAFLFKEDIDRTRHAMERREYDDAEFFLRVADALTPGSPEVAKLRQDLLARRKEPAGFSYRALGDLLR